MNSSPQWQPTASLQTLQLRASVYQKIRHFFTSRQILEVETPILSSASATDNMIEPFYTDYHGPDSKRLFLHTSPELAMKRLLAAGSGSIYQITKAFRDGEAGRWHNPEFSLLEWYRVDFSVQQLIAEMDEFLKTILHCSPLEQFSYSEIFEQSIHFHPLRAPLITLQDYVTQFNIENPQTLDRDTCLQLIMSQQIEPQLGHAQPAVITDFPASQAALARKNPQRPEVAERFEVYLQGVELANGFCELTDPIEQRFRFEQDLVKRQSLERLIPVLDENFLAALQAGLPACSGVALGLDRLFMLITGASHIREVLSFSIENC
ncbi:MAG: hypothetical protein BWK79_11670 [Beggiatoa sp. IS2]|nr:MAG: hypothetical protein BWK79_11670 [Beggiatoa sp. IS2]